MSTPTGYPHHQGLLLLRLQMLFVRQLGSVLLQLGSVLLQLSLRSSVSAAQSPQLSLLSSVSSAQSPQLSLLSSVMMTRTQHGAAARLLDQSELDDGGSVAKANTCTCLVLAASTLHPSARGKDEHAP